MICFCPLCCNLMFVRKRSDGNLEIVCNLCPIRQEVNKTIINRTYYQLKEIDDVLDGEEVWKNVDSTDAVCPKCSNKRAFFMQLQTRSADEPMTTFYRCCNHKCAYNWRD